MAQLEPLDLPSDGAAASRPEARQKGLMQTVWRYLFGDPGKQPTPSGTSGTTKLVIQVLWLLFAAGLLVELAYGLSLSDRSSLLFITWAWISSLAAGLAGAFLGILFGLPSLPITNSSTRVESPAPPSAGPAGQSRNENIGSTEPEQASSPTGSVLTVQTDTTRVEQDLPYNDSTSLEQIADWLTKIIVGLTLTQYDDWSRQFEVLARGLTVRLLGPQADCRRVAGLDPTSLYCEASVAVPGGSILLAFSVLGFLLAYLWMRRYFIIEMVVGKQEAIAAMRARTAAEAQEKRQALDLQAARKAVEVEQQRRLLESERALTAEAAWRVSEAERNRLTAELQAAQARVNSVIDSARTVGNAPQETPSAPVSIEEAEAVEARILENAKQILPNDPRAIESLRVVRSSMPEAANPDDPWSGRFGGIAGRDLVSLLATVSPLEASQFFEVTIEVKADSAERAADLEGKVAMFFLHQSFGERPRQVTFGRDGRAPLQIYAYGAFTVGVLIQDGTLLELNLATIPEAPDIFRSR